MWQEFPNESAVYDIDSQFMVGSGILFAPKVKQPTNDLIMRQQQEIDFYLPFGARWYNYQTKQEETNTGVWQSRQLGDLD